MPYEAGAGYQRGGDTSHAAARDIAATLWIIWDRDWRGETALRRLFREATDPTQGVLL